MNQFRVTKYDPAYRNERGGYERDEWISFSDVGSDFGGSTLTLSEYERVEAAHIEAALGFLREANIPSLWVCGLENYRESASAPAEGAELEGSSLAAAMRGVLRDEFWCRFEDSLAFVRFGYDYYMFVGVPTPCWSASARARELGLFVEHLESPYVQGEVIGRGDIIATLKAWQRGRVDAEQVWAWAETIFDPGETEYYDWEGDWSVACEVLYELVTLPMNLVLPDDIPLHLEFLATPPGKFHWGHRRWRAALDQIDWRARQRDLRDQPPYSHVWG